MTYEIKQMENLPIFVATMSEPHDAIADATGIEKEMHQNIAAVNGTVYYIPDLSAIKITFSNIVIGLNEAFKEGSGSFYSNPRVKMLMVGSDEMLRVAADAGSQDQYGNVPIELFATVDEAVAHAKAQLQQA